jgi:hypothetical protein
MHRSALFAFAMLAGACANFPAGNPPADKATAAGTPIVGGYGPANPSDPNLAEAERLAVDAVYTRDPQRSLVENVTRESQVVAGMNYRFTIKMTGMNSYRVVVYKPLDGAMTVTSFEKTTPVN